MFKIIEKILFPGCCCLCDSPGIESLDLCGCCLSTLTENKTACKICASPVTYTVSESDLICGRCLKTKYFYDRVYAPYVYDYPTNYFVQSLKFRNQQKYARLMGTLLARKLMTQNTRTYPEILLPVPLHLTRYRERGFNQSDLIAKYCGKALKIPVNYISTKRVRKTVAQMSLSRRERLNNLFKAFQVDGLQGVQHVAIIDDVLTTGSTVNEFAKTLKRSGVRQVEAWVFSRVVV